MRITPRSMAARCPVLAFDNARFPNIAHVRRTGLDPALSGGSAVPGNDDSDSGMRAVASIGRRAALRFAPSRAVSAGAGRSVPRELAGANLMGAPVRVFVAVLRGRRRGRGG